jgi:hypothetical protein
MSTFNKILITLITLMSIFLIADVIVGADFKAGFMRAEVEVNQCNSCLESCRVMCE